MYPDRALSPFAAFGGMQRSRPSLPSAGKCEPQNHNPKLQYVMIKAARATDCPRFSINENFMALIT